MPVTIHAPPPEGLISPMTWGVEAQVIERFAAAGIPQAAIAVQRDTCVFRHPGPPAAFLELFRRYYGPTINAFEAAERNGRAADLHRELGVLFEAQNIGGEATVLPATFLRVTVAVP